MGGRGKRALRVKIDEKLMLEFHGTKISNDVGLLFHRELDEALGWAADLEDVKDEPPEQKIRNGWSKCILREALRDMLPGKIRNRNDKIGFVMPQFKENLDILM